jgi:hypothetical protein
MAKQPSPVVLLRPTVPPEPPSQLGLPGAELWRSILAEWVIDDAGSLAVLLEACVARDTAERLRQSISETGDVIGTGNGGTKANPLLTVELNARGLTARLLGQLRLLDGEPRRGPGRPPNLRGAW